MTDNTLKPYVIGLDLGGTNSVFGIVDARGEIKATTAIKTGGYKKVEDYVKAAVEALQPIIDTVGGIDKIKAMGIGAPNEQQLYFVHNAVQEISCHRRQKADDKSQDKGHLAVRNMFFLPIHHLTDPSLILLVII